MRQYQFDHFETLAQRLVEGSFGRLFGGRLQPLDVATRLARALEDSQANGQAATHYRVRLHPADLEAVQQENPDLNTQLAQYLTQLAQQAGLRLAATPQVIALADPSLTRWRIEVETEQGWPPGEATQVFRRVEESDTLDALYALDAFLIVGGKRHVPLDRPVMTIGRRVDNDVVIDSPTISRQHAQIRWRYGRFVIYDLGSRAGLRVNGLLVSESILRPGDVITLSHVPLIYGEGQPEDRPSVALPEDTEGSTLVRRPVSIEQG